MITRTTWVINTPLSESEIAVLSTIISDPGTEAEVVNWDFKESGGWKPVDIIDVKLRSSLVKITVQDEKYSTMIRLKFGDKAYIREVSFDSGECVLGTESL